MDQPNVNRRSFLQSTGVAAVAAAGAAAVSAPGVARSSNVADRIRVGFIGPGGQGFGSHVKNLAQLHKDGVAVDLVAVCDVYKVHADRAAEFIKSETGSDVKRYTDYTELLADKDIDAVCIGTPDHWHAKQTIDAMKAGKHVYCEKPMTHSVEEAVDVVRTWKATGKVMQVGVQSTSLNVWNKARELILAGKLGKLLMFQTEYFRNSQMGQWRYYSLQKEMNPTNIDWKRWLGVEYGLAPDMPFDREVFAQWRRYWPFGSGMFTDLFVHRTTSMLKATGLLFPRRIVGGGGIFLEYDGRDVPDVASVIADFDEGVELLISSSMSTQETPIRQQIRGHFGSFDFGNGEGFDSFEFIPERPQITRDSKLKREKIEVEKLEKESSYLHFKNWLTAIAANDPSKVNNPPDLGAAAIVIVNLGARSYREGKVYFFDKDKMEVTDSDPNWSKQWEAMSKARAKARHPAGWTAGDYGSTLEEPEYMKLAGPWINGQPPANG